MVIFRASNNEYYDNGVNLHKCIIYKQKEWIFTVLPLGTSLIGSSIQVV